MVNEEESTADVGSETTSEKNSNRRGQHAYDYTKSVLLGQQIRTTLSDGRNLTGTLICIDRLKNMILTNVKEERLINPSNYRYRAKDDNNNNVDHDSVDDKENGNRRSGRKVFRFISQAMIPGSHLVKVEIAKSKIARGYDMLIYQESTGKQKEMQT